MRSLRRQTGFVGAILLTGYLTDIDQRQLGKTLWNIADQLRGAMNADDFRDYQITPIRAN